MAVTVGQGRLPSIAKSEPSGEAWPAMSLPPCCCVDAGAAEDGEPDERDDRRHEQHAGDELADRAAARDAGDEHADERRPADPPGPVEDRPAGEPLCMPSPPAASVRADIIARSLK